MSETTPVSRFDDCLYTFTWLVNEDGQADHTTANDAGGETNLGVDLVTWTAWTHKNASLKLPTLRYATKDQLKACIRSDFWLSVNADILPVGVDLSVYDFGFGSGPHTSALMLQKILKVNTDGWIGPATAEAAKSRDRAELLKTLAAAYLKFYQDIHGPSGWVTFGRGWTNRNNARLLRAQQMAGLVQPVVPTKPAIKPSVSPPLKLVASTLQQAKKIT